MKGFHPGEKDHLDTLTNWSFAICPAPVDWLTSRMTETDSSTRLSFEGLWFASITRLQNWPGASSRPFPRLWSPRFPRARDLPLLLSRRGLSASGSIASLAVRTGRGWPRVLLRCRRLIPTFYCYNLYLISEIKTKK